MAVNLFPAFIKLAGRQCLAVGAGQVGASKIATLVDFGACVVVVAPEAVADVQALVASGAIQWKQREFTAADLEGIFMVIAATSSVDVNRAVFEEAQRRNILCNSVDDPPHCDFYFPAAVRRGSLQIAISTAGESPALAQRIRIELEQSLDESLGREVERIGALRRRILGANLESAERKLLLRLLAHHGIEPAAREGFKR